MLVLVMAAVVLQPCAAATTWARASDLKAGIEDIVANQALKLQTKFTELAAYTSVGDLPCTGTDGPFCNMNEPAFASSNPMLVRQPQHSDIDGSCTAIDRDTCGYPLAVPITGRKVYGDVRERRENCKAPMVKQCSGEFEFAGESRADTLVSQGCIEDDDADVCKMNVDPEWVGYSFPEVSEYSLDDLRVRQEICAGNYLVNHDDDGNGQRDPYSIAAVKDEYPCGFPNLAPSRLFPVP